MCVRSNKNTSSDSANLAVPKLSVCADAQKVDRNKLLQTEFPIIEFDAETFQVLLDYLHSGCCPLSCTSIPGEFVQTCNPCLTMLRLFIFTLEVETYVEYL